MMISHKKWNRGIVSLFLLMAIPIWLSAATCSSKLFTVTIDSKLTIGDALENLADTCDLTVVVKDEWAKKRLDKKLYFVKLKGETLKVFLDTILTDNDLHYKLKGNKLTISYLVTKTFRVHYIAGVRTSKSSANVIMSNTNSSAIDASGDSGGGGNTETGIEIKNEDTFIFWKTVGLEVQQILSGANDDGLHYTRAGDSWIGPDGKKWEYNPLAPVVNPIAGMITVTGTHEQLARVSKYINTLEKQLKTQVLIDVRIVTVTFDDSTTTGVNWNELYKLQSMTINRYAMGQKNISTFTSGGLEGGLTATDFMEGTSPTSAAIFELAGTTQVADVVKFLATQGEVKSVSSPRVMTLNNQPAMISVGQDIYYKLQSSTVLGGGVGTTGAVQSDTVNSVFEGVILDITPEVGNNGMITLKINPSISQRTDPTSGAIARTMPPDMIRRQMASVITVKDGHHAIMGGLIITRTGTKINKVPLLGDLPLFEFAFKHEEKIDSVIELVMIITPHIINDSKDVSLRDLGYKRTNGK